MFSNITVTSKTVKQTLDSKQNIYEQDSNIDDQQARPVRSEKCKWRYNRKKTKKAKVNNVKNKMSGKMKLGEARLQRVKKHFHVDIAACSNAQLENTSR